MAKKIEKKALVGGLLRFAGRAGQRTVQRKVRGKRKGGDGGLGACGQCSAVHRAAKMINNKRWNPGG